MTTDPSPANPLPQSSPEAQGIDSRALLAFIEEAEETVHELHSFQFLRHGSIVAAGWWAPYEAESPHLLYSLTKSFTATAAGLAISEGALSLDDTVFSFFPEDAPAQISANLAAMRVRHLLSMSTGHQEDTTRRIFEREDGNCAKAFLELPVEHPPGTHFVYNSGASHLISIIVEKVTGAKLADYLTPRLFAPLGIVSPKWETDANGANMGGWGLSLTTAGNRAVRAAVFCKTACGTERAFCRRAGLKTRPRLMFPMATGPTTIGVRATGFSSGAVGTGRIAATGLSGNSA